MLSFLVIDEAFGSARLFVKSFEQWSVYGSLCWWFSTDDAVVLFAYLSVSDELVEELECRVGEGCYDDSRGIFVETVTK